MKGETVIMQTATRITQFLAAAATLALASVGHAQFVGSGVTPGEIDTDLGPGLGHTIQPDLPIASLPTGPVYIPRKDRSIADVIPPLAGEIPTISDTDWLGIFPVGEVDLGTDVGHRASVRARVQGLALPGPSSMGLLVIAGVAATRRRRPETR